MLVTETVKIAAVLVSVACTVSWLREMLAAPAQEFPQFPAALSLLPLLRPDDALRQLEARAAALGGHITQNDAEIASVPNLSRLFLLESEYLRATLHAELAWVQSVIADLRTGKLIWTEDWIQGAV